MSVTYGPLNEACDTIHAEKYRAPGEDFRSAMTRIASALADNEEHFVRLREILLGQRFMPAGRIQSAVGSTRAVTPYNCFVSGIIDDSYTEGAGCIMERARQAAITMRLGGGIGYDFSTLRPKGELIRKLQSTSSGAVSFLSIFDAVGSTTASSGQRRGAQMGVLRVDHPDIEDFIRAKQNKDKLLSFNLSIGMTDAFMKAVEGDDSFQLRWGGKVYHTVNARTLFDSIMRSTYDWAEPGILFIDRINEMNNLWYCETITTTNPCGEQPLPPNGACLLGSFNLVKYLERPSVTSNWSFNFAALFADVPRVVRAMDNVVDCAIYPLREQEQEAQSKRRMGLGVTGLANTIEAIGAPYGSRRFLDYTAAILRGLRDSAYRASTELAKEKGAFPLYRRERFLQSGFVETLPSEIRTLISEHGIRNSHLLSIAPTGTISLTADNISSGIEPVFAHKTLRPVNSVQGPRVVEIEDYGVKYLVCYGKEASEVTVDEHLSVLEVASQYVDSAVSKTCNLPAGIPWEDFKDVYFRAWKSGCKGCTTYRSGGMRDPMMKEIPKEEDAAGVVVSAPGVLQLASCEFDPVSGRRSCE